MTQGSLLQNGKIFVPQCQILPLYQCNPQFIYCLYNMFVRNTVRAKCNTLHIVYLEFVFQKMVEYFGFLRFHLQRYE